MNMLLLGLVLLIGGAFIYIAIYGGWSVFLKMKGYRRYLGAFGAALLAYGGLAFFSAGIASSLSLPRSFEWPIGIASQALLLRDGKTIALHTPSGRIQVYDWEMKFLYGWSASASSGTFQAVVRPNGNLEVWTARGQKRFLYTLEGLLLETGSYDTGKYEDLEAPKTTCYVPTPWPLLVFAHPFIAWPVALSGGLLLAFVDKKRRPKRKHSSTLKPEQGVI